MTRRWGGIGFAGGDSDLFGYAGGDPINKVDPTGRLDIFVFVWNMSLLKNGSVGHVMATQLDGSLILSEFPSPQRPAKQICLTSR